MAAKSTGVVRAVAYYRMSSDSQEASIPAQRDWAVQAAAREGVRLVSEFEDPGIAGGEMELRPGLQAMLDYCEAEFRRGEPIEAALVWDPDRLSRASSIKTSVVLSRLQDAGVCRVLTASDGWVDLDDVTHRVLYLLKQDLARAGFCDTLARNVLRGKSAKASTGVWLGGPVPYGYRLNASRLEPDPERGPHVAWMFQSYATGRHSMTDLRVGLVERGAKPARGGYWRNNSIARILSNRVYLGHMAWNERHSGHYARVQGGRVVKDDTSREREQDRRRRGLAKRTVVMNEEAEIIRVEHSHPALTDEATFQAVAQRMVLNRKRTTPIRGGGNWVLSGLLRCGACGGPLQGVSVYGKDGAESWRYYACSSARNNRRSGGCWATKLIAQDVLIAEVVETVREQFSDGPALEALRRQVEQLAGEGRTGIEAEVVRLRTRCADLDVKLRQGTANLAILPADMIPSVVEQVRTWQTEREAATRDLARVESAAASKEELTDKVDAALGQLRKLHKVLKKAKPAEQRAALSAVVGKVVVHIRRAPKTRDMALTAVDVEMADQVVGLFTTS